MTQTLPEGATRNQDSGGNDFVASVSQKHKQIQRQKKLKATPPRPVLQDVPAAVAYPSVRTYNPAVYEDDAGDSTIVSSVNMAIDTEEEDTSFNESVQISAADLGSAELTTKPMTSDTLSNTRGSRRPSQGKEFHMGSVDDLDEEISRYLNSRKQELDDDR